MPLSGTGRGALIKDAVCRAESLKRLHTAPGTKTLHAKIVPWRHCANNPAWIGAVGSQPTDLYLKKIYAPDSRRLAFVWKDSM